MNKNTKSVLKFKNYIVDSAEYKSNFEYSGAEKELDFDFDSEYQFDDNSFILKLQMIIFPDAVKNDYPFTMKVEMIGVFEIESELSEDEKITFAEKNAIAILFPYLRAMVSVYTSNANIGATILPPINVVKYLEEKKRKEKSKK